MLDHLEDFVRIPNGAKRLTDTVLALAVSGKLVSQDPKEGTAEELYQEIQKERKEVQGGGKRMQKPLPPITNEEMPFEIPVTWKWVRLGEVTNYGKADKCRPDDIKENTWVLELEDLEKEGGKLLAKIRYPKRSSLSDKNIFTKGDVLYGKLRPYLNKVFCADEDGVASSELMPVRFWHDGESGYLRLVMLSDYFSQHVNARTYGMKMPRLGTEDGRTAPIPLPPLAEQKRIVTKVEEVMGQIYALKSIINS